MKMNKIRPLRFESRLVFIIWLMRQWFVCFMRWESADSDLIFISKRSTSWFDSTLSLYCSICVLWTGSNESQRTITAHCTSTPHLHIQYLEDSCHL